MKKSIISLLLLGSLLCFVPGTAQAITLPPYDFNYGYIDSDDSRGPGYTWIDISATGIRVANSGDDWAAGPYNFGFYFPFFGNYYNGFYVSSNGLITFGGGSTDFSNDCIPNSNTPNNMIAVLWDDLAVDGAPSGIYYQYFADCPHPDFLHRSCMVISWHQVRHLGSGVLFNFQAILFDNGDILMQFGPGNPEYGSGSTTGLEYSTAIGYYLPYACNSYGSIDDYLAILFELDADIEPVEDELDWDEQWQIFYGLEDDYEKLASMEVYEEEDDTFLGIKWPPCFVTTAAGQPGMLFPLIFAAIAAGGAIIRKGFTR